MFNSFVIHFIYADDCNDCEDMRNTILKAINNSSFKNGCEIKEINSDKDEAVNLAIENDIDDLPACVIGNFSFCGKNGYSYKSILEAIEKSLE